MIYTVTFNPSLDYIVTINELNIGKVNRTSEELILAGGKGINVSQVLKNLGIENVALGFVAGFTGEQLVNMLKTRGITTDFIDVEEGRTRINVKIHSYDKCEIENQNTEETEINGLGPVISEKELKLLFDKMKAMKIEDILVISGSVPKSLSASVYADILNRAAEMGIKTIVDASGSLLWNVLEYHPFLIKPNHHELGELFNCEIKEREEVIFYAKELQNRGAQNVLVSMGGDGAILIAENGQIFEMDVPHGNVINTVGAGDSMVAGFLTGFLESNGDYKTALKMGVCAGSASAFSNELATREEVLKLCKSMDFKN